jgi:ABC-type uncharacterized transport system permease subunit
MDASRLPPLPPRPPFDEPKPRGSWLTIWLAATLGVTLAVLLTFLTIGYFGPVILLGIGIFIVIGLQYLVWGWWFERIYRSHPVEDDEPAKRLG